MFDFVRKHTKVMQFVLFLLIFPSFVLFGLEGYNRFKEKGEAVAKVDGARDHAGRVGRRAQAGGRAPAPADAHARRQAAGFARRRATPRWSAWCATACWPRPPTKSKLATSDQRLARELQQNELIASLRGPDGKLDMARYRQLVARAGHDARDVREPACAPTCPRARCWPASAAPASRRRRRPRLSLDAFFEKREVQVARFDAADYAGQGQADRCRARGLLQEPTRRSSRRPSRPASSTWCSTSTR